MTLRHRIIFGAIAVGVVATGLIAHWIANSSFSPAAQQVGNCGLVSLLGVGIGAMVLMGICLAVPAVKRVLLPLASILSLLLLVETLLAWTHSYRTFTTFWWQGYDDTSRQNSGVQLRSHDGTANVTIRFIPNAHPPPWLGWEHLSLPAMGFRFPGSIFAQGPSASNRMGFELDWTTSPSGAYEGSQTVPWWLVAVFFLVLPVWSGTILVRRFRQWRRKSKLGLCSKCGYDLRASSDRCPECGTPIQP